MLNTSRQIDILLFNLDNAVQFGDTTIEPGMNQIRRENSQYNVYRLDNLFSPYAYIYLDEMPTLLKTVYKNLINGGVFAESDDKVIVHQHEKIKLIGSSTPKLQLVPSQNNSNDTVNNSQRQLLKP